MFGLREQSHVAYGGGLSGAVRTNRHYVLSQASIQQACVELCRTCHTFQVKRGASIISIIFLSIYLSRSL